jgi:dipeptidyl aminopeptidase/acylaminoacyl peptidase
MLAQTQYQEIEVQFANGEIHLAGMLLQPQCPALVPAVILIHGSGPEQRNGASNMLRDAAVQFALRGIAALIYDKRGNGSSSGDWTHANFDDLAADAIAGVKFLQEQPGIDPGRVGVWGFSQGGFIAPLVAAGSSDVAFTIIISGAAVTPERQELARVTQHMCADGFSEEDIAEGVTAMQQANSYTRTGNGWETLEACYQEAVNRHVKWLPYLGGHLAPKDHWYWAWWREVMDFNPLVAHRQVKVPVLIILGERDRTVPVVESIPLFQQAFASAGNPNLTIKVLPQANHGLRQAKTGGRIENGSAQDYVPGYFETVLEWISAL